MPLHALVKLRGTKVRQKLGCSQEYIVHEQGKYIDYIVLYRDPVLPILLSA